MAASVAELEARLKAVEECLRPFTAQSLDETLADLDDEEVARLNIVLSFAMTSLFYVFLRTQGVATANHPVKKELARIQSYITKLKSASEAHKQKRSNDEAAEKLLEEVMVTEAAAGVASVEAGEKKEKDRSKRSDRDGSDEGEKKKKKKKKGKKEKKDKRSRDNQQ